MSKKHYTSVKHGDILTFDSTYDVGDLVKYARTPKTTYRSSSEKKTEYSKIQRVEAYLYSGNVVHLKYKMENGHAVEHNDIISVEKKNNEKV